MSIASSASVSCELPLRMLSPPLSPSIEHYHLKTAFKPKAASSLRNSLTNDLTKEHVITKAPTPAGSAVAAPASCGSCDSPTESSLASSPATSDAVPIAKPKDNSNTLVGCYDLLATDPRRYYKRELQCLAFCSQYRRVKRTDISNVAPASRSRSQRARLQTLRMDMDISSSDGGASPRIVRSASPLLPSAKRTSSARKSPSSQSPTRVHDMLSSELEDFSPPTSLLPPGRCLRVEWKGEPVDLSADPHVHLLHPAEVHLASTLRLPAEVYLDSKRRLFAEKVRRLRMGAAFRRTDSQKACRIDVNKASRLFGAFERVGWLDDKLFQKYM